MNSDRNLLFGILALQNGLINQDQLVAGVTEWRKHKTRSLGEILSEQEALSRYRHDLLAALVQEHVTSHQGDPRKSLKALGEIGPVRADLSQLADTDIDLTLSHISTANAADRAEPALAVNGAATSNHSTASRAAELGSDQDQGPCQTRAFTPGSEDVQKKGATGRFQIIRPHARGGLGEVSIARDTQLNREVALKEIQKRYANDQNSRSRFVLEAEITGGLEHPGIVPVYGLGQYQDGRPYYAMRFIRGDSLQGATDQFHKNCSNDGERSFQLRKLLQRFIDVCNSVEYAHSRGVLHRDLKPGNIMLGRYGETLVVDWGLAKTTDQRDDDLASGEPPLRPGSGSGAISTQMGSAIGTPAFMSPEQAAGRLEQLGTSSDVYSLGATLFYVLTGKAPVSGDSIAEILARVESGTVNPPRVMDPTIPKPLDAICTHAMAREPGDRYGSVRELAEDVERFLADEPVSVFAEPVSMRTRRWLRKHPTALGSIAASVVVTLMSLAAGLLIVFGFNRALEDSNARLQTANATATGQKKRAERNFELAKDAVEKYLSAVTSNPKLTQADFTDLREELLETALPFYERILEQEPDDQAAESQQADAYYRLAHLREQLGQFEQSLSDYRSGLEVYERLANEEDDYAYFRGRIHNNMGLMLKKLRRYERSKKHHQAALRLREKMVRRAPKNRIARQDLAGIYNNLGTLHLDLGDPETARSFLEKALALRQQLCEDFPEESEYRRNFAASQYNLGTLYEAGLDYAKAAEHYDFARKQFGKLVLQFPGNQQYRKNLADCLVQFGTASFELSQVEGFDQHHLEAIAVYQQLTKDFPSIPLYRRELAAAHSSLALLYIYRGVNDRARFYLEEGLKLNRALAEEFPGIEFLSDVVGNSGNLATFLLRSGDPAGAKAEFEKAIELVRKKVDTAPDTSHARQPLARILTNYGAMLHEQRDYQQAKDSYLDALKLYDKLDSESGSPQVRLELGLAQANYSNLVRDSEGPESALPWYAKAIATLEQIRKNSPSQQGEEWLRNAYWGRAVALSMRSRFAEAGPDWEKASRLDRTQNRQRLALEAARIYLRAAQPEHTVRVAENVLAENPPDETRYKVAQILAQVAGASGSDGDRTGRSAVEQLERLQQEGFFDSEIRRSQLKTNYNLNALRDREDFKALLQRLAGN